MADSKFLKWQDVDGDGLSEVCNDLIDVPAAHNCPPCVPNPYALTPDWRASTTAGSYFNEKTCQYEAIIITDVSSLVDYTGDIYSDYQEDAINSLLDDFNKENSETTREAIGTVIESGEYYLDPAANSKIMLLYSVLYEEIAILDEASPEDEDEDDEEEDDEEDNTVAVTVTYAADELPAKLLIVRRGLYLYSKYLNVYRGVDEGNLLFEDTRVLFNLHEYGDAGILNGSTLALALSDLDDWLMGKGYNIAGCRSRRSF